MRSDLRCLFTIMLGLLWIVPGTVFGKARARVIRVVDEQTVVINNNRRLAWQVDEEVCFSRDKKQITCGYVTEENANEATVEVPGEDREVTSHERQKRSKSNVIYFIELTFDRAQKLQVGDRAERGAVRAPGSTPTVKPGEMCPKVELIEHKQESMDPLSAIGAGLTYIFPTVYYQQMLTHHFASGISPMMITHPIDNGSIKAWGAYVTFHYYWTSEFRGVWLQTGGGFHFITAMNSRGQDNIYSPAFLATIGWRWLWNKGITFGLAGGFQYLLNTKSELINASFSGLFPALVFDVGVAF
ncbi:MAG: hypothetical protein HY537_01245 [Deltaproteobacteria bacterium]|nr:hypothetical protein [Deltaproteobacteria bacterium]